ncbi:MAG: PBP1A family penicillin-binding protein [Bacillota bacterium]|nr:PBP1A family penicillin-binding protein [Bacillota bacterium]
MTPKRSERKGKRRYRVRWWRLLLLLTILFLLGASAGGAFFIYQALKDMPSVETFRPQPSLTSYIYDQNDRQVAPIPGVENRLPVDLKKIPVHVQEAVVAIEDARFWSHKGIDLVGIARAALNDLAGGKLQGGSTITQQLARTAFPIGSERTLKRKVQEAFLAIQIERHLSKEEILQQYLTWVNFGNGAYGIEAAARTYFDKPASELTLTEGALLAALPNGPSYYNPYVHPDRALHRRNLVLSRMAELKFITREEAEKAKAEPLGIVEHRPRTGGADYPYGYFVDYVIDQLLQMGLTPQQVFGGGLKVYTTLDTRIQTAMEKAVARHFQELAKSDPKFSLDADPRIETAAVLLDHKTGAILAMVGGREHSQARGLNRAVQAKHQPGSAIKPIAVYAPAFAMGLTPATVVDDRPYLIQTPGAKPWIPFNYDRKYQGLTTIREAVHRSVNSVAAETLQMIGVDTGLEYAMKMGLSSLDPQKDRVPSLALGGITYGVSPLEMAVAYGTLANGGVKAEPFAIRKVTDSQGHVMKGSDGRLLEFHPQFTPVLSPQAAYLMTDVLRGVVDPYPAGGYLINSRTAPRAHIDGWQVAGKTGTTNDHKAIWFAGYTPLYTAVVWIGYDKERSLGTSAAGGSWAAPLWQKIMSAALEGKQPQTFQRPPGLVTATIDIKSGLLPSPETPPPYQRQELFVEGQQPTSVSEVWKVLRITESEPQMLWNPGCPHPLVEKTFLIRPPFTVEDAQNIAKAYYGAAYTPEKAGGWVPADVWWGPPYLSCTAATPPPEGTPPGGDGDGSQDTPVTEATIRLAKGRLQEPASGLVSQVEVPLNLTIQNDDGDRTYTLRVKDWDWSLDVPAGQTLSVTVTPKKVGIFALEAISSQEESSRLRWLVSP